MGLAACSTAPSLALERARASVGSAIADPAIVRHAPAELQRAVDALAHADSLWRKTRDEAQTNHLAYMAVLKAEAAASAARTRTVATGTRLVTADVDQFSLRADAKPVLGPR